MTPSTSSGQATLAGLSLTTLRRHLALAEEEIELAQFIDQTSRMLAERRRWQGIATEIRAEIARRKEHGLRRDKAS